MTAAQNELEIWQRRTDGAFCCVWHSTIGGVIGAFPLTEEGARWIVSLDNFRPNWQWDLDLAGRIDAHRADYVVWSAP